MSATVATLLPVAPFTAKVLMFVLALASFVSGNLAYKRISSAYEEDGELPRQRYHVAINVVTVAFAATLVVGETAHEGWITLMFAIVAFVSGIFTYRSMQIQADRGDEALDTPSMHALAGFVLVLYTFYMWAWGASGIGGLLF
jgi:uncharacterized membrane protein YidH (DUF202 family)